MSREDYIPKQDKEKKQKFRLPLSAYLSYLIIATLLLGSVSLAKYTTSTTDSAGARVAKFEVSAMPADGEASQTNRIMLDLVDSDGTDSYSLRVNNNSEVVVRYRIIISNIPEHILVSLNDGEFQEHTGGTVTFGSNGVLDIQGKADCKLTFKADDELKNYEAVLYTSKIKIEVRFDQVD